MSSESFRGAVPPVGGRTKVVGVFGFPVEHSRSPAMHNAAFCALSLSYIYVPFSVAPDHLGAAIRSLPALGIVGVNLTIPHKERVIPHLDGISSEARDVGAVNTVHVVDGRLLGDNTDGIGFYRPLVEAGFSASGRSVVVLGAGGAARSVVFRLVREGADVVIANRTVDRAEALARAATAAGPGAARAMGIAEIAPLADAIRAAQLLVQTTRVGMEPDVEAMPRVPEQSLHPDLVVYDLVYNPVETRLLRLARERGCRTVTGVKMLVYQGAAAFEKWTGRWPPTDVMEAAVLNSAV